MFCPVLHLEYYTQMMVRRYLERDGGGLSFVKGKRTAKRRMVYSQKRASKGRMWKD
jgi:hypothetical protein